jgi:hypothetical protein
VTFASFEHLAQKAWDGQGAPMLPAVEEQPWPERGRDPLRLLFGHFGECDRCVIGGSPFFPDQIADPASDEGRENDQRDSKPAMQNPPTLSPIHSNDGRLNDIFEHIHKTLIRPCNKSD